MKRYKVTALLSVMIEVVVESEDSGKAVSLVEQNLRASETDGMIMYSGSLVKFGEIYPSKTEVKKVRILKWNNTK